MCLFEDFNRDVVHELISAKNTFGLNQLQRLKRKLDSVSMEIAILNKKISSRV